MIPAVKKKNLPILLMLAAVLLATVPRLDLFYGMDGDAARGALAAHRLASTGIYIPSRLPGYPLFEYLLSWIIPAGGYLAANLLVFAFFLAALWAFHRIVVEEEAHLTVWAMFALTPVLLVNSAVTMDYVPGMALLICSYLFALKRRPALCALCLALATGMRLTNVLFAGPLALYLVLREDSRRSAAGALVILTAGAVAGAAFFLPVWLARGLEMFSVAGHFPHTGAYIQQAGYRALMVLGPAAGAGIVILLIASRGNITASFASPSRESRARLALEISAVAGYCLLYLLHPDEGEYLIPVIPFFYLLLAGWLGRGRLQIVAVLVVSFALVTVDFKGGSSGHRSFEPSLAQGVLLRDYASRRDLMQLRSGLDELAATDSTVVITGMGPVLSFGNPLLQNAGEELGQWLEDDGSWSPEETHRLRGSPVYFIYSLSKANVERLIREGFRVQVFSAYAPSVCINNYKFDPQKLGLGTVEIFNSQAFYR